MIAMCRVYGARNAPPPPKLKSVTVEYLAETVPADRRFRPELNYMHELYLQPSNATVLLPDTPNVANRQFLRRTLKHLHGYVVFVIVLPTLTKQSI